MRDAAGSSHDHGNCQLCDELEQRLQQAERDGARHESQRAAVVEYAHGLETRLQRAEEEIAALKHTLDLWDRECGGLSPRDFVAQAVREERAKWDIEEYRQYHNLSFADPPSYHDEVESLYDCEQCVHRWAETLRARGQQEGT